MFLVSTFELFLFDMCQALELRTIYMYYGLRVLDIQLINYPMSLCGEAKKGVGWGRTPRLGFAKSILECTTTLCRHYSGFLFYACNVTDSMPLRLGTSFG